MDPSATRIHQLPASRDGGGDAQKRFLSTPPQESTEWKRQRVDPNVTAVAEATPSDPRLLPHTALGGHSGSHAAAGSGHGAAAAPVAAAQATSAGASAGPSPQSAGPSSSQGVAAADLPVVEAMVRREGTDKFKRFPFDPTMNAEQRAERVQVCTMQKQLE